MDQESLCSLTAMMCLSSLFQIGSNEMINEIIPPAGRELGKLEELPQHLRETWLLVCRIFGEGTERSLLC